jgi:DNA-binding NtrC family response regulator
MLDSGIILAEHDSETLYLGRMFDELQSRQGVNAINVRAKRGGCDMAYLDKEIVVVDDDQGILESFDAMLGDDYSLVTLNNGFAAIEYVKSHKPRLVFLDIKMPGMNGMDVLKKLRQDKVEVAVVMVTATTQSHYESEAEELGITAYLRKPFEIDEVEDITRRALH